jgi:SAM-dependent methyltransferase
LAYEGAEIVHDLNHPVPDVLSGAADLIVDGSTLDNLFSPSIALQNIARMLRPGGRFFSINAGTAHNTSCTVHTGFWFMDYCAINRFADCRVYLIVYDRKSLTVFALDPLDKLGRTLVTNHVLAVVAFGETDDATTWDKVPVQRQYAGADVLSAYDEQGRKWITSSRPEILRSTRRLHFAPLMMSAVVDYCRTRLLPTEAFYRIDKNGARH